MKKLMAFFKRKSGMSVKDFHQYWRAIHADLVVKMPGIHKYTQSHTLLSGYGKTEPIYDGVAEGWYKDSKVMYTLADTPEYAAVREDETHFIDPSTMGWIITEEHVIIDGPAPPSGVKNIAFITRKPGMSVEDFHQYWREIHAPLGASIPMVRRYVQCHTSLIVYESGRIPAYDGLALTWFDDTRAMREALNTPGYKAVRADEVNFMDPSTALDRLRFIITKEHIIVP